MSEPLPGAESAGSILLTVEEAAQRMRLSTSYLNKLRVFGSGPAFHKIGRRVMYRPADLHDWIANRRFTSTSEAEAA